MLNTSVFPEEMMTKPTKIPSQNSRYSGRDSNWVLQVTSHRPM
jgi:hypothetical protein